MSLRIRKVRVASVKGISSVQIAEPVSEWNRMQKNADGTLTIVVNFFENQAALDAGADPFDIVSYQITEPDGFEALIQVGLKGLSDFDTATTRAEDAVIEAGAIAADLAMRGQGA